MERISSEEGAEPINSVSIIEMLASPMDPII